MVVASTTRKSGPYNFNGVTTEWPITFEVNGVEEAEVLVYTVLGGVSTLVESNYTVDLENLEVVYPSVVSGLPAFGSSAGQILIVRDLSLLQGTDFRNQGSFRAEDIEDQLDRWAMVAQQLQEQLDRAAQSDISGSDADPEIAALLDSVSDARDEATQAAASAEQYADAAEASALSATASYSAVVSYYTSAADSYNSAAAYADAAEASANSAAASAAEAAASVASLTLIAAAATGESQSITTGENTKVTLATETVDSGNYFSDGRFTPLVSGYYFASFTAIFDDQNMTAGAYLTFQLWKNGELAYYSRIVSSVGKQGGVTVTGTFAMNGSSDYLEAYVTQDSGNTLILSFKSFSVFKVA